MGYRLGVDIGGTFTDFALFDDDAGRMAVHKQLTTPRDPSKAVLEGTGRLLSREDVGIAAVTTVVHGTTLVTNSVIERKGAITGALVTRGHADVFDIALERRYDLYDLRLQFPAPLVPRALRRELSERLRYDGTAMRPLDDAEVRTALAELVADGVEAVAVCLMHSYADPTHEQRVKALAAAEFPGLYVSVSSEVSPFMREYERWNTAAMNAYTQPMFDRYLARLEEGFRSLGFAGNLYIMTSNGGTVTLATARRFPVRAMESGPAAGALMSAFHGRRLGLPNLLSFDMGGTTAKGALVRDGVPLKKYEMEVARIHGFRQGSGLPMRVPVIDMIEIGSGGGSLAGADERQVIRVGPQSAGADPGPACYGRGGTGASLTDANLVLGYLDPNFFLGGEMALDVPAAEAAIARRVGEPLHLEPLRAAWGIHETINEDVARAFRIHASERGFDYRGCSMVAFGGSGPLHALRIARKLKIPSVIFPVGAGVMSAFGLLVSPLSFEIVKSDRVRLSELTPEGLADRFRPLVAETSALLRQAGTAEADIRILRRLDMRYLGQGYEVEVVLPGDLDGAELLSRLPALFVRAYETVFAMSFLDEPLEVVNWKVEAVGPAPGLRDERPPGRGSSEARKGTRRAFFPELDRYVDCPVYSRYALRPGDSLTGPAVVEENESTCVIGVGDRVEVDPHFNLIARIRHEESDRA